MRTRHILLQKYKDLAVSFAELAAQFAEEHLTLDVSGALKFNPSLCVEFLIRADRHLAGTATPKCSLILDCNAADA